MNRVCKFKHIWESNKVLWDCHSYVFARLNNHLCCQILTPPPPFAHLTLTHVIKAKAHDGNKTISIKKVKPWERWKRGMLLLDSLVFIMRVKRWAACLIPPQYTLTTTLFHSSSLCLSHTPGQRWDSTAYCVPVCEWEAAWEGCVTLSFSSTECCCLAQHRCVLPWSELLFKCYTLHTSYTLRHCECIHYIHTIRSSNMWVFLFM